MSTPPTVRPTRRRGVVATLLVLVASAPALLAACSSGSSESTPDGPGSSATIAADPVDYSAPGPFPVGAAELSTGGSDPRTVYLYYPADAERLDEGTPVSGYSSAVAFPEAFRDLVPPELVQDISLAVTADAPVAEGPFPIVLYSHGFGSHPQYSAGHLAHLASWGFVVAAPDHPSRDLAAVATGQVVPGDDDVVDLRATLKAVRAEATGDGMLAGAVDADADDVAVEGHSAGGAAAAQLVAEEGIDTFIGLAPASPLDTAASDEVDAAALDAAYATTEPPAKPSMLVAGQRDGVIPLATIDAEYDWLAAPKRYAVLANAGHNAFTDLCAPIRAQGGLSQLAERMPSVAPLLSLGEDGCVDGYLVPQTGYAVVNHLVVAQLRWVFGLDPGDASLAPAYVESMFPGVLARYESDPAVAGQG